MLFVYQKVVLLFYICFTNLINNMNRQELKKALPHGFQSEIAKNLGVSFKCVNDYFRGVTNSKRIEMASLEYLATYLEQKRVLQDKIKSML